MFLQNFRMKIVAVHYRHLFLLLMLFTSVSEAEIYKWIDENGKTNFSDVKPTDLESDEVELKINTYESVSYDTSVFNTGEKVVMYSTSWCTYCEKAKRYFDKKGIRFTEYDIEKNAAAKKQYKKLGATGVPVILVGSKQMNGFSEQGFEAIYK